MSKIITVGFGDLLPTQPYVFDDVVDMRKQDIRDGQDNPLHLVPHPDGLNLVVDGHHRTYGHHLLGSTSMTAFLHSSDEDIQKVQEHIEALRRCSTVEDVINRYESRWRPHVEKFGIFSMEDFLAYPPLNTGPTSFLGVVGRLAAARKKK